MNQSYINEFLASTTKMIKQMTGIDMQQVGEIDFQSNDIKSLGICSSLSFNGKIRGRVLLNIEESLAVEIAKIITGEEYHDIMEQMVMMTISELNNIISGDAATVLNDNYNLSIRLAPPIVFVGKSMMMSTPKIPSGSATYECSIGKLMISIAFEEAK